jgi:hypothetical protein
VFKPTIPVDIHRQIINITAWANLFSFIVFDVHIFNRLFVRPLYDSLQLLTLKQFTEWLKRLSHAKFKSCGLGFNVHLPFTAALFQNVTSMYTVCKQTYYTLTASRDQYQNFKLLHFSTFHPSKFTSLDFLEVCPSCVAWFRHFPSFLYIQRPWDHQTWKRFFFRIIVPVSFHSFFRSLVNIKIL